ncbi:MAG: serine/threonine-protein kinase [Labilithrix sp.]
MTTVPIDTTEVPGDLQRRLGRFAFTIFVIATLMLAVSVTVEMASGSSWHHEMKAPSRIAHLVAGVALFVGWWICRGPARSARFLEVLDAALTILLCASWATLGLGVGPTNPIEFSMILALTHTLIGRSVLVPSSFRRSLLINTIGAMPVVAVFVHRGMPFITGASPSRVDVFLLFATLWCAVAVVVAALNSRQLFGLRSRIREIGKLGQYTLEEKIGEGGMGVVYRASHAMLRRPAAIKLLLPDRASEKDLARFEREVQLTSRLAHPNTISIFDFGRSADGVFYYVMEFLDGFDLERLVASDGPQEPARVIRILAQASGALAEAHALGLVHRDIKPANLILTERADEPDVVKVVDFGLVKTVETPQGEVAITNVNAITGTPLYLAPEAITAPETLDARADLYALGAVGYYLLTGKHVFDGRTIVEVCSKHLLEAPVAPSARLGKPISADLEALLLECLAKAPGDRPASAASLRDRLLACADAALYDGTRARSWWKDRGPALRAASESPSSDERALTMAVDLRRRDAA